MPNLLTPIGGKQKLFDERKLKAAIGKALDAGSKDAEKSWKKPVATWDEKPKIETKKTGDFEREVGSNSRILSFVNHGTRPHIIRPVNAPALAFNVISTAKTTPGSLTSGPGGSGGPVAFAQEVRHPGNEPRRFDKAVAEDTAPKLQMHMDRELKKALG